MSYWDWNYYISCPVEQPCDDTELITVKICQVYDGSGVCINHPPKHQLIAVTSFYVKLYVSEVLISLI